MNHLFSRRRFLQSAAVGTAALTFARWPAAARGDAATEPAATPEYRFLLLGDTHYDLPEHHDMDWVKLNKPKDISQIQNYIDVSRKHTPLLLQRVKQVIAASNVPIPFVVHVGDLVEGLCGSFDLASRQFQDATGLIEQNHFGVPFLMCKGNHDITGPGADDAYLKTLLPWISRQNGTPLTQAAFTRRCGKDLFVFFDSYRPDLDWLNAEFTRHADARHTFFIIHQPVVPYNDRANWIVYAKPNEAPLRDRLLAMLGKRNAIVLSGHLHKYSLLDRATPAGVFSQLAVCSVMRNDQPKPQQEQLGLDHYNDNLLDLEPRFEPKSKEERKKILDAEKPFIRRFEFADLPGFAVVDVFAEKVDAQIFPGIQTTAYRTAPLNIQSHA